MNGQIRLTEQGEIISSKFANPEIGRRNLETIVAATLEATLLPTRNRPKGLEEFEAAMQALSDHAFSAYRHLVYETPGFKDYFFATTPITEIADLNLGSRPASRKLMDRKQRRIEDLRAIPWGFSWGQCRLLLPGWFGFGSAVQRWLDEAGSAKAKAARLATLKRMHKQWPFFANLLSNMDMVLSKADLNVASRYAQLCEDRKLRNAVFSRISAEFTLTEQVLGAITGQSGGWRTTRCWRARSEPLPLPRSAQPPAGGAAQAVPFGQGRQQRCARAARHPPVDQRDRGGAAQ